MHVSAERGHTIMGKPVHPGWDVANRRARYNELAKLTNWPPPRR